jgi:hypothetical protein
VTPGAGTITVASFGTIAGSIAVNQVAFGSGANTIAGDPNFTWNSSTGLYQLQSLAGPFFQLGPGVAGGAAGITMSSGLFSSSMTIYPGSSPGNIGVDIGLGGGNNIFWISSGKGNWQYNSGNGISSWFGTTSGSAGLGVAAIAGTPNSILLPITTGTVGQVLTTDGGNPQQTSWTTVGGGGVSLIASGNATLSVTAIPANTAQTVVTVAATGVLATDSIDWSFNAIPGLGYNQGLYVLAYPSAGAVNFLVVNGTANAYTPGAAQLNWRVNR